MSATAAGEPEPDDDVVAMFQQLAPDGCITVEQVSRAPALPSVMSVPCKIEAARKPLTRASCSLLLPRLPASGSAVLLWTVVVRIALPASRLRIPCRNIRRRSRAGVVRQAAGRFSLLGCRVFYLFITACLGRLAYLLACAVGSSIGASGRADGW